MSIASIYDQFVNDDDGYLRWLENHPSGFVVNSHREPVADYLVLHRASCRWINTGFKNNWTTTGYIKTCAEDVAPLAAWARVAASGNLRPCGSCRPPVGVSSTTAAGAERRTATERPPMLSQVESIPAGPRSIPGSISTGCPELDQAWASYAAMILHRSHILIADTDEDLTWHAFLGHSIDMQGFRAAEFAGVDPLTRHAPGFVSLKARGLGVAELAALWEIGPIERHLRGAHESMPLEASLAVLRSEGGAAGRSLAEAFEHFPWRKFHWSIRAFLQNSAALRPFDFSFRKWLVRECAGLGVKAYPPSDFRQAVTLDGAVMALERALRARLQRTFYMVGPAMSAYMLCDWQLWLWRQGRTAVFANFKLDSFHEAFVKKFGRGLIPSDEAGFAQWWLGLLPKLPPRLANECIWLAVENKLVNPW